MKPNMVLTHDMPFIRLLMQVLSEHKYEFKVLFINKSEEFFKLGELCKTFISAYDHFLQHIPASLFKKCL